MITYDQVTHLIKNMGKNTGGRGAKKIYAGVGGGNGNILLSQTLRQICAITGHKIT